MLDELKRGVVYENGVAKIAWRKWRREGDSNPEGRKPQHAFQACALAARPSLRCSCLLPMIAANCNHESTAKVNRLPLP